VILPRKNTKPWKAITAGAAARNAALRASEYLGRALWRRRSGDHRRSRAETKMHCAKLPGQRLMARDPDRQVAEFQIRVAVLNGCTALGIPVTKVAGQVCPRIGEVRPSDNLCNRVPSRPWPPFARRGARHDGWLMGFHSGKRLVSRSQP